MKKLSRLLLETVSWSLFFGGTAYAGPLIAAVAGFATFLGSGTVFASIVQLAIGTALKIGIGLLQRAMNGKDKQHQPGIKTEIQVGGDNPLSFIVGNYATAGQLEYVNTGGSADDGDTPNAYMSFVVSLSDLPVTGFTNTVWIDGQKCTISARDDVLGRGLAVDEYRADNGDEHVWIKFYDGTQTVADPYMRSKFGGDADRPYTSDMVGTGIAYAVVTCRYWRKLFNGIPQFRFEVKGIPLYNPAKDTTNGGSGLHRWNDPTTWEYTENNAVVIYNLARGIYYNGTWIYGGQNLPQPLLPSASFIAAINECNVDIALNAGGTEKQYRCGYEITVDQQPLDAIEGFLDGCSGRMVEVGGYYKLNVGAPPASVYSFTDADIVATEDLSLDPFPGLEATYNGAHASYPEPGEAWAVKDAPPYINPTLEAEDEGRRLLASLTFSTTPYNTQVQRLVRAAVEANRRFRRHVVPLPPETWLLEPGDVVSWTSTREGYANKKFLISAMTGKPGMIQIVSLQEIDPADYDWTPATDEQPYSIGYVGSLLPQPQQMVGWSVGPASFYDAAASARRPSIVVGYSATQDDVRAVEIQVRLASDQSAVFDGEIPYPTPDPATLAANVVLNGVFLPNSIYEVRGKFVPFTGRETVFSDWLSVLTPNVRLGDLDVYLPGMVADINNQIFPINVNVRDLIDEKRKIALKAMEQDSGNYSDKQYLLTQITATYQGLTADYQSAILVAAGPGSVIVQRLDTLEATIPNLATAAALSSLSTTVTTQGGQITANADAITALNSVVGGNIATTLFRATAEATEAGALATIGLSVSASAGGAPSTAAITLSALAGGISRVGILADQFFIKAPGYTEQPFVFSGGVARLNVLNAGTIRAGLLTSPDGSSFVIDLTNGFFSVQVS